MDIKEKWCRLDNTELYVQHCGREKPALLLIHGFLGSTFSWRFLLPLLSPHFAVYAVDLPGFGRSDKGKQYKYSYASYAKSLLDFLKVEGLRKVSVISHSMGGQIAMRLAMLAPEMVQRLILIAASSYLPAAKRWQKALFRLPWAYRIVPFMINQKRIEREFSGVVHHLDNVDVNSMYDGYITPLKDRHFPRALFQFAYNREDDLSCDKLQKVKQPTLLVWGQHDKVVPLHIGERLVRDLPNARLEVVEDTGHLPMEEKPQDVMNRLLPFLTN